MLQLFSKVSPLVKAGGSSSFVVNFNKTWKKERTRNLKQRRAEGSFKAIFPVECPANLMDFPDLSVYYCPFSAVCAFPYAFLSLSRSPPLVQLTIHPSSVLMYLWSVASPEILWALHCDVNKALAVKYLPPVCSFIKTTFCTYRHVIFLSFGLFQCSAPLQHWCTFFSYLFLNLVESTTEPDEITNPVPLSVIVLSGTIAHFPFIPPPPIMTQNSIEEH